MTTFIMMTLSFTVAILLAGVISTVVIFAAMGNAKFIKWLTNYYMKQMMKTIDSFDKLDKSEDL
jgi:hypothetical protein